MHKIVRSSLFFTCYSNKLRALLLHKERPLKPLEPRPNRNKPQKMSSKVLILAANGYIGLGVAQAFSRNGFKIYGSVRSDKHVTILQQNEIIPIIAQNFSDLVQHHHQLLLGVSVLVDAIGLTDQTQQIYEQVLEIAKERQSKQYPKLLKTFTSGIMTLGNASQTSVDESTRPQPTHEWTEQRRLFEWRLLNEEQKSLDTTVIRPGFVCGKNGGTILKDYFTSHKNRNDGKLVLIGSPEKRWSWVHVDDLGEGYVRAEAQRSSITRELFNFAAPNDNSTYKEVDENGDNCWLEW